jgi:hypothetical protein
MVQARTTFLGAVMRVVAIMQKVKSQNLKSQKKVGKLFDF